MLCSSVKLVCGGVGEGFAMPEGKCLLHMKERLPVAGAGLITGRMVMVNLAINWFIKRCFCYVDVDL